MLKNDLIKQVVNKTNVPWLTVREVINETLNQIAIALSAGDKIDLKQYFTIATKNLPKRNGRNIRTGEPIPIEATKCLSIKAKKNLKKMLNGVS